MLAKLKSKFNLKSHSRITNKMNMSEPGVLLRGWFKFILITPSKESQDFEIN